MAVYKRGNVWWCCGRRHADVTEPQASGVHRMLTFDPIRQSALEIGKAEDLNVWFAGPPIPREEGGILQQSRNRPRALTHGGTTST